MIFKNHKLVKAVYNNDVLIKQIRHKDKVIYAYLPPNLKPCEYIYTTDVGVGPYLQVSFPYTINIGNYSKYNNTFKIFGGRIDLSQHQHPEGFCRGRYFQFLRSAGNVPIDRSTYVLNNYHYSNDVCQPAWGDLVNEINASSFTLEDALMSDYFCAVDVNDKQEPVSWGYILTNYFRLGGEYPAKFYSFSVSYNGDMQTIDMHFVPAYDTTLGKYGMYDTINDTFYTSQNQYEFSGKIIE